MRFTLPLKTAETGPSFLGMGAQNRTPLGNSSGGIEKLPPDLPSGSIE